MIGLGDTLRAAGEFIRRHTKSRAVREAEKRRQERRQQEAWRKTRQAGTVAGVSAVGAFGYAVTIAPIASAVVAGGAVGIAALAMVQLWRSRAADPAGFSQEELAELPAKAEEWLLDQRLLLPPEAGANLDTVLTYLGDLPPHLGKLEPHSTLAWEARRLIGDHLHGLVTAWCNLPVVTRERDAEARQRVVRGLGTIADQLENFCAEVSRDDRMSLEARMRFLDSRYRDGAWGG